MSNPATVEEPNAIATGDFNGDGIPDLAVSNSNAGVSTLTILLGNGDGTFTATATSPTVGLYPDSIVVGDFNGDGIADLAVDSVDNFSVTILQGRGDGTFTSVETFSVGGSPQSFATGDFNGDGIVDLAVVNGSAVLIFLGNGDGTFRQESATVPTGGGPITVAVGDFNGDGIPDLAVTNSCGSGYPCNSNGPVMIALGNGDGTFRSAAATPSLPTYSSADGLAVGDFNGDGVLDLAVSNYSSNDALYVFLGNGDGTFKSPVGYAGRGISFRQVVVADFNADGISDVAIGQFWSGPLSVFIGKGRRHICHRCQSVCKRLLVRATLRRRTLTETASPIWPSPIRM